MKNMVEKKQKIFFAVCMVVVLVIGLGLGMLIGRQFGKNAVPQDVTTTATPTVEWTGIPTPVWTVTPTTKPTGVPAQMPTMPVTDPSVTPIQVPTVKPSDIPTQVPTEAPMVEQSNAPTQIPTSIPDVQATAVPAIIPNDDVEISIVPVNPMSMDDNKPIGESEIIAYRPLLHADRIYQAMNIENLPLVGIKIGIDPGHQRKGNSEKEPVAPGSSEMKAKVSSGTQGVSTRVAEYVVNLDVALMLRDELEALGAEVYLTRDTHDIDISNVERALMMNELGVDMVLRIHCNGSENKSTKGISLFVKSKGAGAEESYAICEALMPAMLEATGARNAGIYKRDTYSGMNWSEVPSILVEMGFMSNPEEDKLLNNPNYQARLVEGMIQGIADYMGRELNTSENQ